MQLQFPQAIRSITFVLLAILSSRTSAYGTDTLIVSKNSSFGFPWKLGLSYYESFKYDTIYHIHMDSTTFNIRKISRISFVDRTIYEFEYSNKGELTTLAMLDYLNDVNLNIIIDKKGDVKYYLKYQQNDVFSFKIDNEKIYRSPSKGPLMVFDIRVRWKKKKIREIIRLETLNLFFEQTDVTSKILSKM